jgi:4-hydroxy-tetrahydrodipicolinate synthase
MPVILYLVPSRTGITLDAEQCLYINSRSSNVIAVKDADGDFSRSSRRIAGIVGKMSVYCGNDDRILAYLSMGASGVISVVSNVFPHPVQEICLSFARGEMEKARRIQTALMPIITALFSRTNPMPVKELMAVLGRIYPYARPPLNLTESEGDRLKSIYLQVKEELDKI